MYSLNWYHLLSLNCIPTASVLLLTVPLQYVFFYYYFLSVNTVFPILYYNAVPKCYKSDRSIVLVSDKKEYPLPFKSIGVCLKIDALHYVKIHKKKRAFPVKRKAQHIILLLCNLCKLEKFKEIYNQYVLTNIKVNKKREPC